MNDTISPSSDDSIKRLIARTFAQAGAWALLCGVLILGVGYQINWFITRFVEHTTRTMDRLVDSNVSLHAIAADNRKLIEQSIRTTERVVLLMENAAVQMHSAPEVREKQTQLLEDIKRSLDDAIRERQDDERQRQP